MILKLGAFFLMKWWSWMAFFVLNTVLRHICVLHLWVGEIDTHDCLLNYPMLLQYSWLKRWLFLCYLSHLILEIIVLLLQFVAARLKSGVDLLEAPYLLAPAFRHALQLTPVHLKSIWKRLKWNKVNLGYNDDEGIVHSCLLLPWIYKMMC